MNKTSRVKNSIINSVYASGSQILTLILTFAVRTVFIKNLSFAKLLPLTNSGLFSHKKPKFCANR